jgi:cAMP and cAMP-inhibited cGMP 3',5'-cyclic phosphodiesterase 10
MLCDLQLYEKMRRSEQKYRVALEVLSYHSKAAEDEIAKLNNMKLPDHIPKLTK